MPLYNKHDNPLQTPRKLIPTSLPIKVHRREGIARLADSNLTIVFVESETSPVNRG